MKALLQRVHFAKVEVEHICIGEIAQGLLVFVGVEKQDTPALAEKLLDKLLNYRVFEDAQGKMNCSLTDIQGGLLLVPQFTLAADTRKGLRPSFSSAAPPAQGQALFNHLVNYAKQQYPHVATGQFGADMQITLCNNGPVTFNLQVP